MLKHVNKGPIVVNLIDYLDNIAKNIQNFTCDNYQHTVQNDRDNYKYSLLKNIHYTYNLITKKLLPGINLESLDKNIDKSIKEALLNLKNESAVLSLVAKENARANLIKIQKSLSNATLLLQTSQIDQESASGLDTLNEIISMLINNYNNIEFYLDSILLADSITKISLRITKDENIPKTFTADLNYIRSIIKSNIFVGKYGLVLHALDVNYFPFEKNLLPTELLNQIALPPHMQFNNSDLVKSIVSQKIKFIQNLIRNGEYKIPKYSELIYDSKFNNDSLLFYVWNHTNFDGDIKKLLNGNEILITADIRNGPNYSAIKYNDIGINFKFHNETVQKEFNSVIQNFRLTMSIIGKNYHRCAERVYNIPHSDAVSIDYRLSKDSENKWIDSNEPYKIITNNRAVLSPYGIWSLKLTNATETVLFDSLKKYENETIDLELVGEGTYIRRNAKFEFDVCNEFLDGYYNFQKTILI